MMSGKQPTSTRHDADIKSPTERSINSVVDRGKTHTKVDELADNISNYPAVRKSVNDNAQLYINKLN